MNFQPISSSLVPSCRHEFMLFNLLGPFFDPIRSLAVKAEKEEKHVVDLWDFAIYKFTKVI